MKLNKKEPNRELRSELSDDRRGVIITEHLKYLPHGYRRSKWELRQVFLSFDEIRKLYAQLTPE